jgi:hypothetical protein
MTLSVDTETDNATLATEAGITMDTEDEIGP